MRIGISYWSKDSHAEFAAHEFTAQGQVNGLGQFDCKKGKHSFSGDVQYTREGLKQLISEAQEALKALEQPQDQQAGEPDRAGQATA